MAFAKWAPVVRRPFLFASPLMSISRLLGAVLICCAPLCAHASRSVLPPVATLEAWARDPAWIKLVHYEPESSSPSGLRSAIHSPEFFLDTAGRDHPERELIATVRAFQAAANGDDSPRCRFPARWMWLADRLPSLAESSTESDCPAFEKWNRRNAVESVSIIYATGYLGNPASYYGHTLLKFNFRGDQRLTRLLDVSVNYGAIVGRDTDPVSYIFNSLTGGYDGGFSHIQFYFHNHNYGDIELRDLWEYRLDLPQREVDRIVAHAWEVLGKRYTYHFFRLNCAYRMAEIVQIVDGVDIIPKEVPWVIPQALIQRVGTAQFQGKPLLAGTVHFPSRQTRFYTRYRDLERIETDLVRDIVAGHDDFKGARMQALRPSAQHAVIDTIIDYYQFIGSPLDKADATLREGYTRALSARYQLPPGSPRARLDPPSPPHQSRPPGWMQLAGGHVSGTGALVTLRYRPAYYDALDSDAGHVANSTLLMGETEIEVRERRLRLRRFDLFAVDSVNAGETGLPGDNAHAMKVRIGIEQARLSCNNCLTPRLQADIGIGHAFDPRIFAGVYAGGAIHRDRDQMGSAFTRISADVIARSPAGHGILASYQYRRPTRGDDYGVTRVEARWRLDTRTDVRLRFESDKVRSLVLGVGRYW